MMPVKTPARILLVDDEPAVLQIFSRILRNEGYEVFHAVTGEEAIEAARQHQPNLVLLDVELPDLSGVEVCRQIKNDHSLQDIFVALISGTAISADEKAGGLQSGADDYLNKTIELPEF